MARIYECGFEMQTTGTGFEFSNAITGSPTIDTTIKRSGAASFKVSGTIPAGALWGMSHTQTIGTTVYGRYAIYVDSMTSNSGATVATFDLYDSTATNNALAIQLYNNAGTLAMVVYYNAFGGTLSNTASLSFDTWHVIEFYYNSADAAGADDLTIWVDGTQVAASTTLTLNTTPGYFQAGVYNGTGADETGTIVYFDDIALNDTTGTECNGQVGLGKLVLALPTGAGDNAATTGIYSYINEIPPSDTATTGSTMVELDTATTIADYTMTSSTTLGIDSYDTIVCVSVRARVREETAGTSNYALRLKSASGGTVSETSLVDAGNATARTNPSGTTAFGLPLRSYLDPTTGVAWTPTGTNSIDNMQVGAKTTDGTPDIWVLWLGAYVEYQDGTPPASSAKQLSALGVG